MYRGTDIMKKNKLNSNGFTIIEVLIVLAIAGLIMAVVFLAVPGLQRSQWNSSAKTDASHIAASITNYIANNNGTIPLASNISIIYGDTSTLSELKYPTGGTSSPGILGTTTPSTNTWYYDTGATGPTAKLTSQIWSVDIDVNAVCPSTIYGSSITTTLSTTSQIALLYTTVTSNGSNWNCLQVQ
jgi:prepilin-type N-terminal cleavage/methylation domain-containing protein